MPKSTAKITYDYETGPVKEENFIEITDDIINLLNNGKAIMLRKTKDGIVAYIDCNRWYFKQR